MYLERLLQINIATMAALGTLLLGMGQRSAALPLWMLTAAIASLWLTDFSGRFRLNRTVTNVAAATAFVVFLWQLAQLRGVIQILAIGNLLVYLQIILLFQDKEPRTYWQLALLSLLQVVVAAAFHQKVMFGLLMVVYLFVGLSALVLLTLAAYAPGSVSAADISLSATDPEQVGTHCSEAATQGDSDRNYGTFTSCWTDVADQASVADPNVVALDRNYGTFTSVWTDNVDQATVADPNAVALDRNYGTFTSVWTEF